MKFYQFDQNNSGGSFAVDSKLCHRLFIEAESLKEAKRIAKDFGVYFNGCDKGYDCPCCGDRWYKPDEPIDLEKYSKSYKINFGSIEEYAQYLADNYGWTKPDGRIFFNNGNIKEIFKSEK